MAKPVVVAHRDQPPLMLFGPGVVKNRYMSVNVADAVLAMRSAARSPREPPKGISRNVEIVSQARLATSAL